MKQARSLLGRPSSTFTILKTIGLGIFNSQLTTRQGLEGVVDKGESLGEVLPLEKSDTQRSGSTPCLSGSEREEASKGENC